jgi:hypothetical protein
MSRPSPNPVRSPDSDISLTSPTPVKAGQVDYFSPVVGSDSSKGKEKEIVTSPAPTDTSDGNQTSGVTSPDSSRKASVSSLSFRQPRNPSLPQGSAKRTDSHRIRAASPPHQR